MTIPGRCSGIIINFFFKKNLYNRFEMTKRFNILEHLYRIIKFEMTNSTSLYLLIENLTY